MSGSRRVTKECDARPSKNSRVRSWEGGKQMAAAAVIPRTNERRFNLGSCCEDAELILLGAFRIRNRCPSFWRYAQREFPNCGATGWNANIRELYSRLYLTSRYIKSSASRNSFSIFAELD